MKTEAMDKGPETIFHIAHRKREYKTLTRKSILDYDGRKGSVGLRGQALRNNTVSGGAENSVQRGIIYAYFSLHYIHLNVRV